MNALHQGFIIGYSNHHLVALSRGSCGQLGIWDHIGFSDLTETFWGGKTTEGKIRNLICEKLQASNVVLSHLLL